MNTDILIQYIIYIPAILISITIHEFTKAAVSTALGDSAPKSDKRLTLNPFKHFEPIGFILFMFLGFGWGKPVRTSGVYYKNRMYGTILVYSAPIIANIIFSFIFALCSGFTRLVAFNAPEVFIFVRMFLSCLVQANLSLAIFNIIPVAPLCGNKILAAFMSPNEALKIIQYEKIFQIILIMLLFFGVVGELLNPVIESVITFYNFVLSFLFP